MRKLIFAIIALMFLSFPVSGLQIIPPEAPDAAQELMPDTTADFSTGLQELLRKGLGKLRPDLAEASRVSLAVIAAAMLVSILKTFSGPVPAVSDAAGTAAIAGGLLLTSNTLIRMGTATVTELTEYGKLLLPVMTTALAAQGGVTKSAAVFAGTAAFSSLLGILISQVLIPLTYLFLALSIGNSALGENMLKQMGNLVKSVICWCLKTILTVFTGYIGLTGIVTGTTDAAALKTAKAAVSTVVPVVGNILSNASETVLLSAGVIKNAAGIYGILAILAVMLEPFLRILAHYWILKITAVLCSIFGTGRTAALVQDFSAAMGFLLAMTGSACLLLLIGIVCFMKGVG